VPLIIVDTYNITSIAVGSLWVVTVRIHAKIGNSDHNHARKTHNPQFPYDIPERHRFWGCKPEPQKILSHRIKLISSRRHIHPNRHFS